MRVLCSSLVCVAVSGDGRTWPTTDSSADLRQWWVQLEALAALNALAVHDEIAGAVYARERDTQWEFLREHYFDSRFG